MDFFEAQDNALARSKSLIVYFFIAVVLIVVAVYFAVTAGFFYYHSQIESATKPPVFDLTRLLITGTIVLPLIGFGSLWRITQLRREGGAGVATALGGRRIDASTRRPDERKLRNIVEEMAIAAGLPVPQVYVMDRESGINAFAAGFSHDDAAIGVTRGAIEQLDRDELQGVIAHEFSHILNGDMSLNTKLSGWVFGIVMLTLLGRGFWRLIKGNGSSSSRSGGRGFYVGGMGGTRRSGGGSRGNSKGGGALILAIILVAVLITIIGFIGEFFTRLIQAAVSRQREYLADASAVQFTRNPEGIGNALRRIGGIPRYSTMHHPNASEFAHSFFARSMFGGVSFLATHPPLDRRIRSILKDWKGDFLKPRPSPKREAKVKKKAKSGSQIPGMPGGGIGRATGGGDNFQQMLTAGLFMRSLGQLRENSRQQAGAIREQLENDWPEVFEDVDEVPPFLLALLYAEDEGAAVKQRAQLEASFPEYIDDVPAFAEKLAGIGRSERLILTELLAARLPDALIESEREGWLDCLEAFIQADDAVHPFEIACLQMARRSLLKTSDSVPTRQNNRRIVEAARVVATRIAAETETMDAAAILAGAARQAPYFMNQIKPAETTDAAALEAALDVLSKTPFGIRKQFLELCERIVAADQKAAMDEVELLRAIAIGIGVPAAPILAGEFDS
ncbi:MAG: M48 family metalloprotease [Verrucomicrobia bacterium]|jgi:Zn-dependent protease with chaperone function|nr:M48 family metalloprotease [Verrucomicrobiota bacterium]